MGDAEHRQVRFRIADRHYFIRLQAEKLQQAQQACAFVGLFGDDCRVETGVMNSEPVSFQSSPDVLGRLKADRLRVHHTGLDRAIVAKETDKGTGLLCLLKLFGLKADEVVAIGDSEPDLPMFRVAHSSFAPGHISCRREAKLLGCWIADLPYQP